jgi:hypothetical protein
MKDNYTIVIEEADKNQEKIKFWESMDMEAYELPDNIVLMVDKDAPEEIKDAALDAQGGDYEAYLRARGIEDDGIEEVVDFEEDDIDGENIDEEEIDTTDTESEDEDMSDEEES